MIQQLYIKDFALIDELEITFGQGLSVLTGETGAGKSVIVGALNMILGERADTEVIRKGSRKAIAEATISAGEDPVIRELLEALEIEYREELILRREIRDAGSRAFINDTPVTIAVLKQVGDHLVDLHGQHDHQLLLKEENHALVLDRFDDIRPLLKVYREEYEQMVSLKQELRILQKRERDLADKMELYEFQFRELEAASLDPEEEEATESEMHLLDHAETLNMKAETVLAIGSENEVNVMDLIHSLKTALEEMAHIDPAFESYLEEVRSARISIQEAVQFTERYRDQIEFNPDRLEELRVRQSELNRLQKKYGRSVAELIEYQAFLDGELGSAESMDVELERLQSAIESQAEVLKGAAVALHNQRVASGERLSAEIVDSLKELGIPSGAFRVEVRWMTVEGRDGSSVGGSRSGGSRSGGSSVGGSRITGGWFDLDGKGIQCTENGCDEIRFFISTNKGEDPKPLSKIASGGEISRVMLSLKSILAKQQRLPVMIFDEIDTGISGAVSEKVGRRMRGLSSNCQIIAITHQPQIASQAHNHYRVEKVEDDERVITRIVPLSEEEHIEQVARLMSGEQLSVHAIESARQLVKSHQS